MGLGGRKYILPAATESLVDSSVEETGVSADLATDISRRTDRTSATIPDDGSPVTITTGQKIKTSSKSNKGENHSQTSLLIEYYEGQKEPGSDRRPSLRVRVRPSTGKNKDVGRGYLAVTREQGARKPSYTQRIPLAPNVKTNSGISISSVSETREINHAPIDIEIGERGSDISDMSASPEARYIAAPSDISSMPADSMLGTNSAVAPAPPAATSSILSNSELGEMSDLKPPVFPRERNLSHERITQKAIEKLSTKERESSKSVRSGEKSRSRSGSTSHDVRNMSSQERRRKSGRTYPEESSVSGGTESMISNSVLSAGAKSLDEKSVRSGASNITNPKLLQTVEDAIRRLILPELKEIKRTSSQRARHKDDYYSDEFSDNSITREKDANRRIASGSRSKRRISNRSGSGSQRRHHQDREVEYESPSEGSFHRRESISSVSVDHEPIKSNEKASRSRNIIPGAVAGAALTAAALQHQDSSSTLERRQRRKRSKSHSSRSASVAESEDTFEKHAVPHMPFRSEIGSELTRSSLLSSNTTGTPTPTQKDVREVIRGSPYNGSSPGGSPAIHGASDLRQTLGTHHRNISGHDLGSHRNSYEENTEPRSMGDYSPEMYQDNTFGLEESLTESERIKAYERNLHQQHPIRRGLSPIQSVASYQTTEPHRHSAMHARSIDSMSSSKRRQQLKEEVSMDSFLSASPSVQKSGRPQGLSLENRSEIMHQHNSAFGENERAVDELYDDEPEGDGQYRQSYESHDPKIDVRHLTNYTDDSADTAHVDMVAGGQQLAGGLASNPEYIHTPPGVESAVASLIEPSILDMQSPGSPYQSATRSVGHANVSTHSLPQDLAGTKSRTPSPLKQQTSFHSQNSLVGKARVFNSSPPQSPAHSFDENQQDVINLPQGENISATSPESEITTNPSVIHGPIGGFSGGSRDHWPYAPTPDRSVPNNPAQQAMNRDLSTDAPDLIPEALNLNQRSAFDGKSEIYTDGEVTPLGVKDEGYHTADNTRSPGLYAKQNERPAYTAAEDELQDDPFHAKRNKYMSGLSQGMSPLYDNATGQGIDRIQSKDIVALMNHLTVRDAQRNARDTEILFTLVQSATEMRNSFEEMKQFIAEQDEWIMTTAEKQHSQTQKAVGGPRPQPRTARTNQKSVAFQEEEPPTKWRNLFKRRLQGLGSKNVAEIQNIEQMLMQLLDEVDDLRLGVDQVNLGVDKVNDVLQPNVPSTGAEPRIASASSIEQTRVPTDTGYEPEGQAGTSSTGDRSGNLSNQSSRHEYRIVGRQRDSVNRPSTVIEGDEEEYDISDTSQNGAINRRTALGSHLIDEQYLQPRVQSVPITTPPKMHDPVNAPWSNENVRSAEPSSARKNKSITSASFFPKLMSRWSKTTASTEPRFSVQTKPRPYSQVSRSGSDLGEYSYEPQAGDRLRSNTSLQEEQYDEQENRPPSPLVPSQVSENPKYQGYRNSKDLAHPQPRQGSTGRHQTQLENEAQHYHDQFSPASQTSSQWDSPRLNRDANGMSQNRYQPQPPLSPISDDGYSETSDRRSVASSRRHTKIMDDEPLVPQRPPKLPMSPSTYVDHVAAARAGSPAYDKSPVNALRSPQGSGRKPSGPRPYNGGSLNGQSFKGDLNTVKKTRFRGSPYQISSNEDLSH